MTCKIQGRNRLLALLFLALSPALACAAQPPQPAILRFKFGPAGSPACAGFLPVTDQTKFTADLGYGWLGKVADTQNREGPDALFRSWIASDEPFAVTLPDGAYFAWFVVGDNDAYPRGFVVTQSPPQGKAQTLLTKKQGFQDWWNWYFSLQDVEWDDVQSLWNTYVEHKFKSYTVPVAVTGGRMQLSFGGAPVCCLAVYPEAAKSKAEALLAGVREAQRAEFDKAYQLKLPNSTVAPALITPAAEQAGLVVRGVNYLVPEDSEAASDATTDAIEGRADSGGSAGGGIEYGARNTTDALEGFAAPGQSEPFALILLALRDVPSAKVAVSDLKSPEGAVLPASAVEVACQRYAIWPNAAGGGGSHLAPRDIVRREVLRLHARVPQRVWLTIKVPGDAKPGAYAGVVSASSGLGAVELPIRFKILPIRLDPAAQVLRGGYYYFPWNAGDRYWELVENDLKFMAECGMNSVPELPDLLDLVTRDGQPNPKYIENIDRFIGLCRKYNFTGAIPAYSFCNVPDYCGFPPMSKPNEPISDTTRKRIRAYIATLKAEEKKRGWPEIVIYASDELSNDGPPGAQWGVRYLTFLDEIKKTIPGGFRTCSSINGTPEFVMAPLLDFIMPNRAVPFTQDWIDGIHAAKHDLWLYNCTWGRFDFGFYVWRCDATGRFQWHFDFRPYSETSNPYNPYDYSIGKKYVFGYPTREGVRRATPESKCAAAGIYDLRYLVTLEKAIAANPGAPAAKDAAQWLAWLHDHISVNPTHYAEFGEWHASVYDRLRWKTAQLILQVQGQTIP